MQETTIENIEARLEKLSIFELRQTARAVGVDCPAAGTKAEVKAKIIAIANGEGNPKASEKCTLTDYADKELVKDIQSYRESIIGK